jgi:hypothetical protein
MGSPHYGAGTTITERRSTNALLAIAVHERDFSGPSPIPVPRKTWRVDDPPAKTVADLVPEDIGKRIVIRSGDFLGTVYGTLLGICPHPSLVAFTGVQLYGKKELTFRNDMEALVLD